MVGGLGLSPSSTRACAHTHAHTHMDVQANLFCAYADVRPVAVMWIHGSTLSPDPGFVAGMGTQLSVWYPPLPSPPHTPPHAHTLHTQA